MVGICGNNGVGKTNLLDAVYYTCFTRSYFTKSDALIPRSGSTGFRLEAHMLCEGKAHQVTAVLRETGRKEIRVDDELITRLSQYIGRFPAVMVCPDDTLLITGASDERRHYLDLLFSQLDPEYLQWLQQYHKLLQFRNSYLKQTAPPLPFDPAMLDSYDYQLAENGSRLFEKRKQYLDILIPLIHKNYIQISGKPEELGMVYQSQLFAAPYRDLLQAGREKDRFAQRTQTGIHKDDLEFSFQGHPFKNVASQGQRKSLLFACKMAEFELLKSEKGFAPLLLLDDVFEKLDDQRMQNLLQRVCVENEGQVFLTDTHPERMDQYFKKLKMTLDIITL